jgi:predicted dehydrogenase
MTVGEWRPSSNDWDWLGHGIYFWERAPRRALRWALERYPTLSQRPAVLGAYLQLGRCFDLLGLHSGGLPPQYRSIEGPVPLSDSLSTIDQGPPPSRLSLPADPPRIITWPSPGLRAGLGKGRDARRARARATDKEERSSVIGIGIVGYGYWGPNLARNFSLQPDCRVVAICDGRAERRALAAGTYPACQVTADYHTLLDDPRVAAVVIATPVSSHFALTRDALLADKDVLVEKPLTRTSTEAEELIRLAEQRRRVLAVDHTFLYTDAVRLIKQMVDAGELGEILYIDSVRTNLGLFQPDHNVIVDLAPHELSIALHLLGRQPTSLLALGACHAGNGYENLAYVHVEFGDNVIAHFHLNWLAPVKVRQTMVVGTKKMILYDDMQRSEKVKIYDKGIAVRPADGMDAVYRAYIMYRTGDMVAPHLNNQEALAVEAAHFLACVRERKPPLSDGQSGLQVVRLLEAAQRSLQGRCLRVEFAPPVTAPWSAAA